MHPNVLSVHLKSSCQYCVSHYNLHTSNIWDNLVYSAGSITTFQPVNFKILILYVIYMMNSKLYILCHLWTNIWNYFHNHAINPLKDRNLLVKVLL
jgi:hypothetical protein